MREFELTDEEKRMYINTYSIYSMEEILKKFEWVRSLRDDDRLFFKEHLINELDAVIQHRRIQKIDELLECTH